MERRERRERGGRGRERGERELDTKICEYVYVLNTCLLKLYIYECVSHVLAPTIT